MCWGKLRTGFGHLDSVSVAGCLGYDVLANIDRSSFNRSQFQLLVV